MKFNVTKKENELYEKLNKLVKEFQENGQTIYASFAIGNDMGGTFFCGDEWKLVEGFYTLLKNGLSFDSCETDKKLAFALFNAMQKIVEDGGTIEKNLVKTISWIWSMADYEDEDGDDEEEEKEEDKIEIEVTDSEPNTLGASNIEEERERLIKRTSELLGKMGYYVAKKPTIKPKTDAKKPKDKK